MKKPAASQPELSYAERRRLAEQFVREYFLTWQKPDAKARRFTSASFRKGILEIYRFVLLSEGKLEPALKKVGLIGRKPSSEQVEAIQQIIRSHVGKKAKLEARSLFVKLLGSGASFSKYILKYQVVPGPAWLYFSWRLSKLYFQLRPLRVRVDPAKIYRDLLYGSD